MEDIKIKISNTEAANIEIVPTETGVEIVIHKNAKTNFKLYEDTAPKTFAKGMQKGKSKSAIDTLTEFCSEKKGELDKKGKDILLKFYQFWSKKCPEWKGEFRVEKFWEDWIAREKDFGSHIINSKIDDEPMPF